MAVPPPSDAERVICALRLGWAVSELRGRLRPRDKLIKIDPLAGRLRDDHALPLGGERTVVEQLIEAESVVCLLAQRLDLDRDLNELTNQAGQAGKLASVRLIELAKGCSTARKLPDGPGVDEQRRKAWLAIAQFLYDWDARMQDLLAGAAFSEASAYQLGRGLGEIAWLDPTKSDADQSISWTFVLGSRRVDTLKRLVKRLADYFQPFTAAGVSDSLDVWAKTVDDAELLRSNDGRTRLVEQTKRWRDLLLTNLDPMTLLPPSTFLERARQLRHVLRSFRFELVVAGLGALLTAFAAAVLASAKNYHGLAAAAAVVGLFGITASGLVARAKSQAQALIAQLRAALDADLVVEAVIVQPKPQPKRKPWWHFW